MTEDYQIKDVEIEAILKKLGKLIGKEMPTGWGFTLLMFDFNKQKDESLFYISNGNRQDVLKTMLEFISKETSKN